MTPPVRSSGIGWTKAKHASAMIVTTVAQLLTKLRLILEGFLMQGWSQDGSGNVLPLQPKNRAFLRQCAQMPDWNR